MANAVLTDLAVYQGTHMIDLFLKPALKVEDYTKIFRIIPDVVGNKTIYFREQAAKIMKKVEGCTFVEKGQVTITDEVITTVNVGVQIQECWSEFLSSVFEEAWLKSGTDKHDMTGTEVERIFIDFITEGMTRDISRVLWWGKATSASADFNWFDGWFRCILDNTVTVGFILDISTFETGGVLDADAASDVMSALYKGAPTTLWQLGKENLNFYVSRGFFENYADSLIGTVQTDSAFNTLVDGVATAKYQGVSIVVLPELDADLADPANEIANGVAKEINTTSNNVCLLTTPSNLVIGIDANNVTGQDAKIWYSMDDDQLKGRVNTMLGAVCFLPELFAVAY